MRISPSWIRVPLVLALAASCKGPSGQPTQTEKSSTSAAAPVPGSAQGKHYGEAFVGAPAVGLKELLAAPQPYVGKAVKLEGHVRRACTAKGCWMELAEEANQDASGCRVTFKDYGFFVPTDSAGASALVEGEVVLKRVKRAHVEHLQEEGATFQSKNDDGSASEVRIVATAVELQR